MTSHPPRVAIWILRTLGSGPDIEALLGDLSEEYRSGRSRVWFWWQVLTAIPITLVREVRAHVVLIVRAVALGWLIRDGLNVVASLAMNMIELIGWPYQMYPVSAYRVEHGVKTLVTVRMNNWQYVYQPLLGFLMVVSMAYASAWLVARLHSRVRTPATLAFTAMVCFRLQHPMLPNLAMWWIYPHPAVASTAPSPDTAILIPWFGEPWFFSAFFFGALIASLLGGLAWSHRQPRAG